MKLFTLFTHHIFSIIVKENQASPASILQKQALCVIIGNTHTYTIGVICLYMHKKRTEVIDAVLLFFFLQNITQSKVPNIEKFAIQQTILEQTAVVVKHKGQGTVDNVRWPPYFM